MKQKIEATKPSAEEVIKDIRGVTHKQYGAQIATFVERYNQQRYHESHDNLTPVDVYFGRGQTILLQRERTKRKDHRTPALAESQSRCLKCQTR